MLATEKCVLAMSHYVQSHHQYIGFTPLLLPGFRQYYNVVIYRDIKVIIIDIEEKFSVS